jgi:GNAT superfamily N-acetyltransferase
MDIRIRILEKEEFSKLDGIYQEHNDKTPNPNLSVVAVAEDGEEIVGMAALVLTPMVTMWIHPEFRSGGVWKELVEMIYPFTADNRTYVIATKPETIEMCKRIGLREIEHPVFVKDTEV